MQRLVVGAVCLVLGCGVVGAQVTEADGDVPFVEPDTGLPVVDFDVLSDGAELSSTAQGLTVALVDGRDDVWGKAQRQALSYCVERRGFGSAADEVVKAMDKAARDWEASANVQLVHALEEDTHCSRSNTRVVFNVRAVERRPYLARSFFPSSPRSNREVLVDGTALTVARPLTLAGVLRHELGHVLGLRHEHTRQRSNRCYEDATWRAVTAYDVRSVMHYPQCAGVTGHDLVLTELDRQGIAQLYP